MPSVFISRALKPDSPFHNLGPQWRVESQSLLQFTAVPVAEFPRADWYFVYSSTGVSFMLEQGEPPVGVKLACLGAGAAKALQRAGYTPDFVGDGNPQQTTAKWLPDVQGSKVVFVQAKQSRSSVQQLLGHAVDASQLVVYDNRSKESFSVRAADYLIFTSPLNFQAYRTRYRIETNQRIIGIGHTTAVTFSTAAVKDYRIANVPSEAALVECLLKWEAEHPI